MVVPVITKESGVHAEVNYVRNARDGSEHVLEFVTEDEGRSTMQTRPGREVWIENARPLATDIDREGFVLLSHTSSITDFDQIQEEPTVDQQFVERRRVEDLLGVEAHVIG